MNSVGCWDGRCSYHLLVYFEVYFTSSEQMRRFGVELFTSISHFFFTVTRCKDRLEEKIASQSLRPLKTILCPSPG